MRLITKLGVIEASQVEIASLFVAFDEALKSSTINATSNEEAAYDSTELVERVNTLRRRATQASRELAEESDRDGLLALLRAIMDAGEAGISSNQLQARIRARTGQAIGRKLRDIRQLSNLTLNQFKSEVIYRHKLDGEMRYFAGPRFLAVYNAIKHKLAKG